MKFYKKEVYIVFGVVECYKFGDIIVIFIIFFILIDYNIIWLLIFCIKCIFYLLFNDYL